MNDSRPFPDGGGWRGVYHIGRPVPMMLERVLRWLKKGDQVAIVTARVAQEVDRAAATDAIEAWCLKHLGQVIPVTHSKDFGMFELWDDRAIQVIKNTGERADGFLEET